MSYSIYIGEAEMDVNTDPDYRTVKCCVNIMEHKDAPNFNGDVCTGISNGRHPGYSQWSDFCEETGLYDLFYNKEIGFLSEHPGCFSLLPKDLETVKNTIKQRKQKYPNKIPGWCQCKKCDRMDGKKDAIHNGSYDYMLARLIWLEYWIDYALKNCKNPAIYNS